jgi:ketosteroid isomerase-like protein
MNKRSLFPAVFALLISVSAVSSAAEIPASSFKKANARVEKEITAVLDALNKAYLEKNVDEALSIVANDENIVFIGTSENDKVKGIESLKTAFRQDFDNFETLSAEYPWIDITTNGKIALVASDFTGMLKTPDGNTEKITARQTLVLEKRKGKWLILQSHFSFPVEMIQKAVNRPETKEQMEKEIDEDLNDIPVKDEDIGSQIQEEITDEKLVDEDA